MPTKKQLLSAGFTSWIFILLLWFGMIGLRAQQPAFDTVPLFKFTYTFRLKPAVWNEGQTVLFRAGSDPRRPAYRVHYRSQWLWVEVDGHTFHLDAPPAGAWTHFALTFDGRAFRAYYNGVLKNDYLVRARLPTPAGPLLLGGNTPGTSPFTGELTDFRFYDRALDPGELLNPPGDNSPPVAGANDPPVATARTIPVRANAPTPVVLPVTDADDGEWLRYTVTQPTHGTLTGIPPDLVYTPTAGYVGTDAFTFAASDGVNPAVGATVTLSVQVLATFNVRTHGAVGDGVADDTRPIRDAIAAAEQAGGGTVYFPTGTYAVAPQAADPSWINEVTPHVFDVSGTNLEFLGDGPGASVISVYTVGLRDPNTHWTVIGDGSGYFKIKRGGAFALTNRRVATFENIAFRGLRVTGNTRQTGNSSVGGIPATGDGWDLSHKCIKIPDSNGENVFIENCVLDGWRGEVVYGGGNAHRRIFVRDTVIHDSNASAISIGSIVGERVTLYDVYNGVENFALGYPQKTEMKDCTIERAHWGIVYIGRATSRCTITGSTIKDCRDGAVFLSELARNVVVRDNLFVDNRIDLYTIFLNQYPGIPENGFEGILFQHNVSKAINRTKEVCYSYPAGDHRFWTIRDNQAISESTNGNYIFSFARDGYNASLESRRNYYVLDNQINDTARPYAGDGFHVRPLWYGNTGTGALNVFDYSGLYDPPFELLPEWDRISIGDYRSDGRRVSLLEVIPSLPVGFEVEISCRNSFSQPTGAEIPPDPAWNTLTRGYMIYNGLSARLRLNAARKFDLVSYAGPGAASLNVHFGATISARGNLHVNLAPYEETTYRDHVGIAENTTVQIAYAAGVNILHNDRIHTPNGETFVGTAPGTLTGTRTGNVLVLSQPGFNPALPAAPGYVTALAVNTGTVSVRWRNQTVLATSLVVERQAAGANGFSPVATLGPDATAFTDVTPISPGAGPSYRVRAVNASGSSLSLVAVASRSLLNWRTANLGGGSLPGASEEDLGDPDGDGISNLLEYATARYPQFRDAGEGALTVTRLSDGGTALRLTRQARPDLVYTVESSADLTRWDALAILPPGGNVTWTLAPGVTVNEPEAYGGPVTVNLTMPPPGPTAKRFFRLRVGY